MSTVKYCDRCEKKGKFGARIEGIKLQIRGFWDSDTETFLDKEFCPECKASLKKRVERVAMEFKSKTSVEVVTKKKTPWYKKFKIV